MTKKTRVIALVLALAVAAVIVCCSSFLILKAEHDCAGSCCMRCCQLLACENMLGGVSLAAAVFALVFAAVCARLVCPALRIADARTASLVGLKVKISD